MEFLATKYGNKSRLLPLAIGLFILFDLTILATNFWLSAQIAKDAVDINLAGRQRMLSQRMVKSLLQLEDASQIPAQAHALAEAELTFNLFLIQP
jgi:nitrate/nitrite-specific signal transduction histidine kinase